MAACNPDGKRVKLVCTRALVSDAELHIRHGTAVTLRGVRWLVTDQTVLEPLFGRPLLEALGLNTRNILAASAEKHSGAVDVPTLFGTNLEVPKTDASPAFSKASTTVMVAPTMRTSTTMTAG